MITFTDDQGSLGTIERTTAGLVGSTAPLQRMADRALRREAGSIPAAYARLLRSGNAYVQVAETADLSGDPDAIELTGSPAWLHELRAPNGEWVHSPADVVGKGLDRYKVPPHERLINPRARLAPDPADYAFFKKHPVSVQNIIDAYDATTPEERAAGMKWYSDAHLLTKAIGLLSHERGGHVSTEDAAILLGNYSSAANWPINMFRAARVAAEGKPIPKGEGYVSGDQVKKALKALAGQHVDDVLISPKTRSFAHLLANGQDSPDDPYGHVVIDAHALNVAAGGNLRGITYTRGKKQQELPPEDRMPLEDARAHEYVADLYREAAHIVSQREGRLIAPHQMQAITWVGQVLANQAADKSMMENLTGGAMGRAKGRLANEAKDWRTWLSYAKAHHLKLVPGVSALAAEALLAQIIELTGADSFIAQALDLAYNPLQPRGPDGRWIRAGSLVAQALNPEDIMRSEQSPAHATRGDLRTAVIDSKLYTVKQFDQMQRQIAHLQKEMDDEHRDEARAVLTTHLGWIAAGIAVAVGLTLLGFPVPVVLLAGLVPTLGQELSELGVATDHGKRFFAHPAKGFRVALQHGPAAALNMAADDEELRASAISYLAQVLMLTGYTGPDVQAVASALVSQWMEDNADRLAAARGAALSGGIFAQVIDLDWHSEPRDPKGRWTRTGGIAEQLAGREREYQQVRAERARTHEYPVIGPEGARGDSRPVSHAEFQELARAGNAWIDQAKNHLAPIKGLDGPGWLAVKARAYAEARKSWGGTTIDTDTGKALPQGADLYALSVKPRGMVTVKIPEHATAAEFGAAMDQAKELFRPALERRGFYLGVFHDDDLGEIHIDPVAIVDSVDLVEQVGSYTHAIGGAFHFKTGNGYWPPHVAEGASMADDDRHFEHGYAQWHSQAVDVQDPEPDDLPAD